MLSACRTVGLAALCAACAGCAAEHLLRAQDKRIEELRLENTRQEDAIARARQSGDELKAEWNAFLSRETSANKEATSFQSIVRRLAQKVEDAEGKRAKLEDRLKLAETKGVELNQAFTQVSAALKNAEVEMLALRQSRQGAEPRASTQPAAATAAANRPEGFGDPRAADSDSSSAGALLAKLLASLSGIPAFGATLIFFMGAVFTCIIISRTAGARSPRERVQPTPAAAKPKARPVKAPPLPAASRQESEKEEVEIVAEENGEIEEEDEEAGEADQASEEAPAEEPVTAAQPVGGHVRRFPAPRTVTRIVPKAPVKESAPNPTLRLEIPPSALDEVFKEAESTSIRFAESSRLTASLSENRALNQEQSNTQVIADRPDDHMSRTDIIPSPVERQTEKPSQSVRITRRIGAGQQATELQDTDEIPAGDHVQQPTQVIGMTQEGQSSAGPTTSSAAAGPASVQGSKPAPPALQPRGAPDERELLAELENLIGYKIGEKTP